MHPLAFFPKKQESNHPFPPPFTIKHWEYGWKDLWNNRIPITKIRKENILDKNYSIIKNGSK